MTRQETDELFRQEDRQRKAIEAEDQERDRKAGHLCPRCKSWKRQRYPLCDSCTVDDLGERCNPLRPA